MMTMQRRIEVSCVRCCSRLYYELKIPTEEKLLIVAVHPCDTCLATTRSADGLVLRERIRQFNKAAAPVLAALDDAEAAGSLADQSTIAVNVRKLRRLRQTVSARTNTRMNAAPHVPR